MSNLDQTLVKVASKIFRAYSTPVSALCEEKLQTGDVMGLLSLSVDPRSYNDIDSFRADYFCTSFLRKARLDSVVSPRERRLKAVSSFWQAERECCLSNVRFSRALHAQSEDWHEHRMFELLEPAKRWISDVLGPLPHDISGKFGPGATYEDRGRLTTILDKMSSHPTITGPARALLPLWHRTEWSRALVGDGRRSDPKSVPGNRFTTVSKDALKDRGICIEPSLNVFYQLGVGKLIKARLRRAGVDLDYAQFKHRIMAQEGSLLGALATIDLSNASDTVSYKLVQWLLPECWFALLDLLRSPKTKIDGNWVKLEKFSSMGNGYTFELETLIFASIAYACGAGTFGSEFSVFGDDIIVPTSCAKDVVAALKFCGFTLNPKKTFLDGPFRESCGGDFFNGQAVRPHHVEEIPSKPEQWISLANGIRRMARQESSVNFMSHRLRSAWRCALDALPKHIRRLAGPESLGDSVIHDDTWETRWDADGIGWVRGYTPIQPLLPLHHWSSNVIMAAALFRAGTPSDSPLSRGVAVRGTVSGYKVKWIASS